MEISDNQNRLPIIIQPNAITAARYDYSQMQKDFMYHFIDKMNKYMTKDHALLADLFGNVVIEIDLKEICKSGNYAPMLEAIRELQKKPISYQYDRNKETYEVDTHLIASLIHKKGSGKIRIKSTEESLPFLSYLGSGFTSYNKVIALSLQSFYAKRLYEICCRWKDKGFYRTTIKEFRKMMSIEDKFESISDLRRFVLDKSIEMLSQGADYSFTYTFRKENKSKAFNWLELNIMSTAGESGNANAWYSALYNVLYLVYHDSTAMHVCDYLAEKGELKKAAERFIRLKKDMDSGKIKTHGLVAYVNKVLESEFEVPETITFSKLEKLKKQRKAYVTMKKTVEKKGDTMKEAAEKVVKDNAPQSTQKIVEDIFNQDEQPQRTRTAQKLNDLFKM